MSAQNDESSLKELHMSIRLGDIAPDFEQDSSEGRIRFHEWLGNSWGVLFSHPPTSRRCAPPNWA